MFSKGVVWAFDLLSASFEQLATLDERLIKVSVATSVEHNRVYFSGGTGFGSEAPGVFLSNRFGELMVRRRENIRNRSEIILADEDS
jgi:hypothetical protein